MNKAFYLGQNYKNQVLPALGVDHRGTKATIERNKAKREAAREANPRQHKKGSKGDKEKVQDAAPNDQLPAIGGEEAHAFLASEAADQEYAGISAELLGLF
eukprot:975039-Rhodomonas_salina.1